MSEQPRRIRVANIVEEGEFGGPQVRIVRVAYAIQGTVETTVVMPGERSEAFRKQCDAEDVPYKTFWMSRITREWTVALRYVLFSPFEVVQLAIYFKNENFNLIHVSGGSWQYKGIIAAKLAGIKAVWHLNDTSMPWLFRKIFGLFSHFPDAYIFASERSRIYYDPLIRSKKRAYVIPAPVVTSHFKLDVKSDSDFESRSRWAGKIVIGTVANVNPIKGLDVFISVAATLNKQFDNLQFVVIGNITTNQSRLFDRLKVQMKELRVKNVEFTGRIDDVRSILSRITVYLCTSYAESSPISVWEAMSMGKPIVSTDVGDVGKYVVTGKSGEILPVGSVNKISNKIIELLNDNKKMKTYGANARKIAVNQLDISFCADRHIAAYREIVG